MPVPPEALAAALRARPPREHPALPGRTNHLRAGVLVPLRWREGTLEAIATLRPTTLRRHGGEVSFPGGRPEPADPDLRATALRETHEELGVARPVVLGRLASMPVWTSDWRLEPFVAALDPGERLQPDPGEVEAVLAVDVGALLAAGEVEGIVGVHDGTRHVLPVFRPGGHVMYGATALVLWELIEVVARVAGRAPPRLVPGALTWEELFAHRARAGALATRG